MHQLTSQTSSRFEVTRSWSRHPRGWGLVPMLLCVAAIGCGPAEPGMDLEGESLGTHADGLLSQNGLSTNGLSTNGLSTNGLSTNGLSTNGLSTNGLSTNGLSTNGFSTWFGADPARSDEVMRYMARCALASGQSLTYTHAGTTYTWTGVLGLAPGWAGGATATLLEQQVVSGCLAAHVNKYGVHLNISVLGRDALGAVIPTDTGELTTYNQPEAVFFGNLFNGEGLFAANDADYLSYDQSTVRACGLSSWAGDPDCAVVIGHVGSARTYCQLDTSRTYYTKCTYNGKAYRPITTRIRTQDIYHCGDGTCQLSESCGTSTTAASCQSDCGVCP
ncbi:hypothetical protein [Pyxidicoccus trucidator]|uniref:hypothetical protein n=1 Tax=Pyxidicoccus trucidator TaxID=2709662 RepID=UPI0013DD56D3|nr:hypothetical protein [Pyxidicoccus trucidator]